jgi:hypothetical protein
VPLKDNMVKPIRQKDLGKPLREVFPPPAS